MAAQVSNELENLKCKYGPCLLSRRLSLLLSFNQHFVSQKFALAFLPPAINCPILIYDHDITVKGENGTVNGNAHSNGPSANGGDAENGDSDDDKEDDNVAPEGGASGGEIQKVIRSHELALI